MTDICIPDWAKSIFVLCMLLPGCPASPEGPGGPRAPGIPIRPGSPRDIITINKPEVTDLQSANPFKLGHQLSHSTFYLLYPHRQLAIFSSSVGRWSSMTKEFCSEKNCHKFTASSIVCLSSMLTWLTLQLFWGSKIPEHEPAAIFSHPFYKSTSCQIRKYLQFYHLKGIPYLFHLAVHHGQFVLSKEKRLLGNAEIVQHLPFPPAKWGTTLNTRGWLFIILHLKETLAAVTEDPDNIHLILNCRTSYLSIQNNLIYLEKRPRITTSMIPLPRCFLVCAHRNTLWVEMTLSHI